MRIAIIGLPRSGKTTIFNAATRGRVAVGDFGAKAGQNIGVAKVPDSRLPRLAEMFNPQKVVQAEITYVDMPGPPPGQESAPTFGGETVTQLQKSDALLHVVRGFQNPAVPHPKGSIDPWRDLEAVGFDLLFADIALIDRRIQRITEGLRGAKAADRDAALKDIDVLKTVQADFEAGKPVRSRSLSDAERRALRDTFLVSGLPYLVALNIDEENVPRASELEAELGRRVSGKRTGSAAIAGQLEMELGQMSPEDEAEFRSSLGAAESGMDRLIRLSYEATGLISFLTVGEDEVRAWSIEQGTVAVKAAGKVHSDIERGFIRAEVVRYDDLVTAGGLAEARKAGTLRSEGRDYLMKDGDVVNFLFSV
ncbi:MAG: redox-regulated ATPase YchF [Chloroflexi bacterium]|nr:redox-regulated ATPase YchF [Chloroflexota bacterium]